MTKAPTAQAASIIRQQLGDAWESLHPDIRQRFARDPQAGESIRYTGTIDTDCSCAGQLFARLTQLIGNPLTPYRGRKIPLHVRLFRKTPSGGVCWERTYLFPGKKPYVVTSIKQAGPRGEMLECVGGGFGMVLVVTAENAELHFRSIRYFWQCGRFRIPLPHAITPGRTHVIHANLGAGNFRFAISMDHPWLGRTFHQDGVFRREEAGL